MDVTILRLAFLALSMGVAGNVLAQSLTPAQQESVPEWATAAMRRAGLDSTIAPDARLNPFILRGDFDGDGRADIALLVRARTSGKHGIAIVHRATGRVFIIGAGRNNTDGGDDYSWMDAWTVFERGAVARGATNARPPLLKGDALLVAKSEAASAILYWTGTTYRWYQQGD